MSVLRVYPASTAWVKSYFIFEVDIYLGFGVYVRRHISPETIFKESVRPDLQDAARHCFVILLGGKNLFVDLQQIPDIQTAGALSAKVYVDVLMDPQAPCAHEVPGVKGHRLSVRQFFDTMLLKKFDPEAARVIINRGRLETNIGNRREG